MRWQSGGHAGIYKTGRGAYDYGEAIGSVRKTNILQVINGFIGQVQTDGLEGGQFEGFFMAGQEVLFQHPARNGASCT